MKVIKPQELQVFEEIASFSRASTGTYVDKDRSVKTAGVDEPRYNYNPNTLQFEGLLVEPKRTNYFLNSNVGATQSVSVPNVVGESDAIVFSFYGVGSVTITRSGFTRTLVGEGTYKRVYTVFENLGQFTYTVSGSIVQVNLEGIPKVYEGGVLKGRPTSWIPTTSSEETREADYIEGYGLILSDFDDRYRVYDPIETYDEGERVVFDNYIWESSQDSNSGNEPSDATTFWIKVQVSNKFASLDNKIGIPSYSYGFKKFAYRLREPVDSIALLGLNTPNIEFASFNLPETLSEQLTNTGPEYFFDYDDSNPSFKVYEDLDQHNIISVMITPELDVTVVDEGLPTEYVSSRSISNPIPNYDDDTSYSRGDKVVEAGHVFINVLPQNVSTTGVDPIESSEGGYTQFEGEFVWEFVEEDTPYIGEIVVGELKTLGRTLYNLRTGIRDYSRKETDQFGNTIFTVRSFAKIMSGNIDIDNEDFNNTLDFLYSIRATPTAWIATDAPQYSSGAVVFGYYRDFDAVIPHPGYTTCSLEIEGLSLT